jgi:hypothetical protein
MSRPTKRTAEQDRVTAHHEAGHAVVAVVLNTKIRSVSIESDEHSAGRFRHSSKIGGNPEWDTTPRVIVGVERQVVICLAGLEAQKKYRKSSVRNYHGETDFHNAVDMLSYFTYDGEELDLWLKLLECRARQIVQSTRWWPVIRELAAVLIERRHLSGSETLKAIHDAIDKRPEPEHVREKKGTRE